MRGRLESASSRARETGPDQALITDTMADLDDVLRMFSSLTRISQIETTRRTSGFRAVDLVEDAVAETASEVRARGGAAHHFAGDVTQESDVVRAVRDPFRLHGVLVRRGLPALQRRQGPSPCSPGSDPTVGRVRPQRRQGPTPCSPGSDPRGGRVRL